MLYAFGGGIILGLLMLHTRRLWPCMAVHMAINLRALLGTFFMGGICRILDLCFLAVGILCTLLLWKQHKTQKEESI